MKQKVNTSITKLMGSGWKIVGLLFIGNLIREFPVVNTVERNAVLYVSMTARFSSSSFRTVSPDCTPHVGHNVEGQEVPCSADKLLEPPLPKALAPVRESLKTDRLVLALLRLRLLALDQCRSARKSFKGQHRKAKYHQEVTGVRHERLVIHPALE